MPPAMRCPCHHIAGEGTSLTPGSLVLGKYLLNRKHHGKRLAAQGDPIAFYEVIQWEQQFRADEAVQKARRRRELKQALRQLEADNATVPTSTTRHTVPGVSAATHYSDDEEFDVYQIAEALHGNDVEDDEVDQHGDEPVAIELDSDSDIEDVEESDEDAFAPPASVRYGENPAFPTSRFFRPVHGPLTVEEPENPWYPFESDIHCLLYMISYSIIKPPSQSQIERIRWLCAMCNPHDRIPALNTLKRYRNTIPRPEIGLFWTPEKQPYYQLNIDDIFRMQLGIPATESRTTCRLQQYPEVLHAGTHRPHSLEEPWHGDKWRCTPQLHRPVEIIDICGISTELWIGDVLLLEEEVHGANLGVFAGCERHTHIENRDDSDIYLRVLPLRQVPNSDDQFWLDTCRGIPKTDENSILMLLSDVVRAKQDPEDFKGTILSFDQDEDEFCPLAGNVRRGWFEPHPLKKLSRTMNGPLPPITLINVSICNDGTSTVSGSRWNPVELFTLMVANKHHQLNFLSSNILYIAAGAKNSAVGMLEPILEQLRRLQRGISVYDATKNRNMIICGGLLMGIADNPAASAMISHKWKSTNPCRVCPYDKTQVRGDSTSHVAKLLGQHFWRR